MDARSTAKKDRDPKTCKKGGKCNKCDNNVKGNKSLRHMILCAELIRGKSTCFPLKRGMLAYDWAEMAGARLRIFFPCSIM